jgi:thioredoxin-dependent peroxiredoxin
VSARRCQNAGGYAAATLVEEGARAPDFTLESDTGEQVTLSSFRGRHVVLYFYPRDDTPGCAAEACSFRDDYEAYQERRAVILGVSPDDTASHVRFKDKYALPFTLLADPGHKVAEQYGAWGEKVLFGKKSIGLIRSTFVIDPEGKVAKAISPVRVQGHSDEVLAALP